LARLGRLEYPAYNADGLKTNGFDRGDISMAAKNVVELNQSNWQQAVTDSQLPVVVDFWAVWCGPCRMIAPTIEQLADEYAGKVVVGKVNVDDNQELAAQFRINTIPQVYVFKNGEVVEKLAGAQPKSAYVAAVEKVLKA
jgi:thioredoxin 1